MGTLTLLKISVMELHYNYQMEIKDTDMGNNTDMGSAIKVALQYAGKRIKWHIKQMVFQLMGGVALTILILTIATTDHEWLKMAIINVTDCGLLNEGERYQDENKSICFAEWKKIFHNIVI